MFFENLKLAFSAMIHNKMRTLLSLLGIVIGVGAVVAILNLGASAKESINDSISSGGLELVTIYPTPQEEQNQIFDLDLALDLGKEINGIDSIMPVVSSFTNVRKEKIITSANLSGVESNYARNLDYNVVAGQFFTSQENILRNQVVVLGSSVAEELFPYGNAVGNYISIFRNQAKSYKVVGVMEEKDPALNISFNNNIYIPFNTFSQKFSKVNNIGSYVLKVKDDFNALDVEEDLKTYLNSRVTEDDYQIFSPATLAEMANQITSTFSAFLAAIAAISLLVGGIGIMNIMLVSVTERTKEIGIRKALGASPSVIMGQFITEALALTLFGGLVGILLGTLISYGVVNFVSWKLYISTSSYILAVGFSTLIGVFFGWYPAYKASRLDPIDALNYE